MWLPSVFLLHSLLDKILGKANKNGIVYARCLLKFGDLIGVNLPLSRKRTTAGYAGQPRLQL